MWGGLEITIRKQDVPQMSSSFCHIALMMAPVELSNVSIR